MAEWIIGDEFVSEFNRMRSKIDGASGQGLHNTPSSLSHSIEESGPDGQPTDHVIRLKIIASVINSPGRYTAHPFFGFTNNNPTTLREGDLGNVGGNTVEIWNLAEIGKAIGVPPVYQAGDLVQGVLRGFNSTNGQPIYHVRDAQFDLFIYKWCPTSNDDPDCKGNAPQFTLIHDYVNDMNYLTDDYEVFQQAPDKPCDPRAVLFMNRYNTFLHYNYAASTDQSICNTKLIRLWDQGSLGAGGNGAPALSQYIQPNEFGVTYNKYSGYFTMSAISEEDQCSCYPNYIRKGAKFQVDTYIDPCSFSPTVTDGTTPGKIGTLKIGSGLTLTWNPTVPSGCDNIATISAPAGTPLSVRNTLSGSEVAHCCNVGLLDFNSTFAQPSASTDSTWQSSGSDILKVPVFTDLACNTYSDPCDSTTKGRAVATQYSYFDPCWAYTTISNCDASVTTKANKITFGAGFTVATAGSGCATTATITPNITITGDSATVSVTGPTTTDCGIGYSLSTIGYTGDQTVQVSTSWDGTTGVLSMTQITNTYTNGVLTSVGTPFNTTINTADGCT
jgi:hypothetical protein